MKYTLRNIPPLLDLELRRRAKAEGKSLNVIVLEALVRGSGVAGGSLRQRDLSDVAGTWQEDPELDEAVADQDRVDERLWQ